MGAAAVVGEGQALATSFSRLTDFEKCPAMAYGKYVEKRPEPEAVDRTHADRGVNVHTSAEKYVKGEIDEACDDLKKVKPTLDELRALYATGIVEIEEE